MVWGGASPVPRNDWRTFMSWIRGLAQRLRVVFRFSQVESELDPSRCSSLRRCSSRASSAFRPSILDFRRRALGAPAATVVWVVVGAGLRLTSAGIFVGMAGGLALARSLATVLFDVRPYDPGVFAAAAGVLLATGVLACIVPALRAVRIDPISILRAE
jgi:hypothetical protein